MYCLIDFISQCQRNRCSRYRVWHCHQVFLFTQWQGYAGIEYMRPQWWNNDIILVFLFRHYSQESQGEKSTRFRVCLRKNMYQCKQIWNIKIWRLTKFDIWKNIVWGATHFPFHIQSIKERRKILISISHSDKFEVKTDLSSHSWVMLATLLTDQLP